jgi:hypothetical protein
MVTVYIEVVRRHGSGGILRRCSPVVALSSLAAPPSLDQVRDKVGEETDDSSEPHVLSPWPPLPLIWHCAIGAHQTCWVGRHRSVRRSGPESAVGLDSQEINSNILPLDLILYFNFKL